MDRNDLTPRRIAVHFTPPDASLVAGRTVVVIDTLRATSTILTLIVGGATAVYPCATEDEARALAAELPDARLCGEREGLPVDGFEFGNSPTEFAALDVTGWTVVQTTSNGTRALALAPAAAAMLIGCLRNARAVADLLRSLDGDIAFICAGEGDAQAPSVEDSYTAGAIVRRLVGEEIGHAFDLESGARLALRVYDAYHRGSRIAFHDSPHAQRLRGLGFQPDVDFCAQTGAESAVPRVRVDEAGRPIVRG